MVCLNCHEPVLFNTKCVGHDNIHEICPQIRTYRDRKTNQEIRFQTLAIAKNREIILPIGTRYWSGATKSVEISDGRTPLLYKDGLVYE